jgi:hypothetical protein
MSKQIEVVTGVRINQDGELEVTKHVIEVEAESVVELGWHEVEMI